MGFQPQGAVTGHVFTDTDGDGGQGGGEPDAAGVTVTVADAFGGVHTAVTDGTGDYTLTGVPQGSAGVDIADPFGSVRTAGTDPQTITVTAGLVASPVAVGFQPQGSLSGHVFTDTDADGQQDVGEPAASNLTVTLTDAYGGVRATITDRGRRLPGHGCPRRRGRRRRGRPGGHVPDDLERPADRDGLGRDRQRRHPRSGSNPTAA